MKRSLAQRIMNWALHREPDLYIGGKDNPYLVRWHLIPRNPFFNIYVHQFLRSDDDRALHDHPWLFNMSWLMKGSYLEHLPDGSMEIRMEGDKVFRWGSAPHRVELIPMWAGYGLRRCWTLFITGPVVREWGFYCPKGWVPWKVFVETRDGESVTGRGCE